MKPRPNYPSVWFRGKRLAHTFQVGRVGIDLEDDVYGELENTELGTGLMIEVPTVKKHAST